MGATAFIGANVAKMSSFNKTEFLVVKATSISAKERGVSTAGKIVDEVAVLTGSVTALVVDAALIGSRCKEVVGETKRAEENVVIGVT